jgi:hypothetical protein
MWRTYFGAAALLMTLVTLAPKQSSAFDITGGSVWENRVGPGIAVGLGLNGCVDGICRRDWGTRYSIGGIVGFHYRLIPNVVVFGDIHAGHIGVDYDYAQWDVEKDNGFIFEVNAGGEFHVPITGWLAPYAGFGIGWAYVGSWAHTSNNDYHFRFTGLDLQPRIGADFFPFSQVENLSLGLALFLSFPVWIRACAEDDGDQECNHPDEADDINAGPINLVPSNRRDDLPKLVFFGILAKYWF